ncbi:50S ribosomal protein L32 [Candidatus Uhrbacteria bacterium]|nr:50S ribosomal protein L32 [Candidatus Uhrbacteria bacterium]
MGLPGKRLSRSSKRRRASHFALAKRVFVKCSHCAKPIMPHRVCAYCGHYKEKEIVPLRVKKASAVAAKAKTE